MPLVPIEWLGSHVELPAGLTPEGLAAALVRVGLEEETIHAADVAGPVVVGRVLTRQAEEHKNGKVVNYCRVDVGQHNDAPGTGKEPSDLPSRGIVCGAHNFDVGDYVVVSLPGAVLPGGFAISARKTYGHLSDGMICSMRELGLGEDHDGIIVLAAAGGCLVVVWPLFFGGAAQEREAAERIAALATWAESLRDTIAGAVGLEQAVPATVHAASPVIRDHLALLADRMRVRVPLPTALRQFADDLDDPTADLIVSALIMNARLRGPGLRSLLGNLAATARTELDMRQRVSASRAGTRRSAQIVIVFSILMIMGLALFNPGFVSPYDSAQGQVVLLVVVGLFAAGMMWMRRLAGIRLPRRFLTVTAPGGRSS